MRGCSTPRRFSVVAVSAWVQAALHARRQLALALLPFPAYASKEGKERRGSRLGGSPPPPLRTLHCCPTLLSDLCCCLRRGPGVALRLLGAGLRGQVDVLEATGVLLTVEVARRLLTTAARRPPGTMLPSAPDSQPTDAHCRHAARRGLISLLSEALPPRMSLRAVALRCGAAAALLLLLPTPRCEDRWVQPTPRLGRLVPRRRVRERLVARRI